jgi:hypothetical protein
MKETNFTTFLNLYGNTILDMLDLKIGIIHDKVMKSIEKFHKRGYENLPAIGMTLRKYKHLLEEMMLETDDEETEEDENDDVESDDESEDEDDENDMTWDLMTNPKMRIMNEKSINVYGRLLQFIFQLCIEEKTCLGRTICMEFITIQIMLAALWDQRNCSDMQEKMVNML